MDGIDEFIVKKLEDLEKVIINRREGMLLNLRSIIPNLHEKHFLQVYQKLNPYISAFAKGLSDFSHTRLEVELVTEPNKYFGLNTKMEEYAPHFTFSLWFIPFQVKTLFQIIPVLFHMPIQRYKFTEIFERKRRERGSCINIDLRLIETSEVTNYVERIMRELITQFINKLGIVIEKDKPELFLG